MNDKILFWSCESWISGQCKNGLNDMPGANPEESLFSSRPQIEERGVRDAGLLSRNLMTPDIPYCEIDSVGIYSYVCIDCSRKLYKYVFFDQDL